MKKLLACSSLVAVACIVALIVRGNIAAASMGHFSPNCHGKYYPMFWYSCLVLFTCALLLCLGFLLTFFTRRIVYSRLELILFFLGFVALAALIIQPGPVWFAEWFLGDCLNYGHIWW